MQQLSIPAAEKAAASAPNHRLQPLLAVGVDVGYGFTKIASRHGQLTLPTVIGEPNHDLIVLEDRGPGQRALNLNELIVHVGDRTYFLGQFALAECDPLAVRTAENIVDRVRSTDFAILFRAALALALGPQDHARTLVVTGLPLTVYRHERDELKAQVKGTHVVWFVDPVGQPVRTPVIEVEHVVVVPQPLGSFADLVLDDAGNVVREDLMNQRVAVLDLGFGTSDLLVLREQMQIDSQASRNIPGGMSSLVERLKRALHADPRFRILQPDQLQPHELEPILRTGQIPGWSREIDGLREVVEEIKRDAVETFIQRLQTALGRRPANTIVLTGGGAALLSDYLVPRLQEAFSLSEVLVPDAPSLANARGFLRMARQYAAHRGIAVA